VTILGVGGIAMSRAEYRQELAAGADGSAPVANVDHWHAAYGIYLCDEFAPTITDDSDPKGIHSHGDGIIHIHPFVRSAAGRNATLGVFADAIRMTLEDDELEVPGGESYKSGETKCGDETGIVQVKVNDKVITEEIANIKLNNRDLVTIAFAPKGAELPEPLTKDDIDRLDPTTDEVLPEGTPGAETATTLPPETQGEGGTEPAEGDTSTTAPPPAEGDGSATTTTAAP
jgi:hypothetical protein